MSTLKSKPQNPYWTEFSSYQSFSSVEDMLEQIKRFEQTYILTPTVKAVLNTIKLHAKKTFIGVCWLYREEIAKKAKVSLASVKRAIKLLKESGILKVYPHIHTTKGGKSHNVYVINPIFETSQDPSNEPSVPAEEEASEPTAPTVSASEPETHKNSNTNSNKTLKDISIKGIPTEFVKLMEPFYANNQDIIRARWKTVCVAVKNNCSKFAYTSWDTIGQAWKDSVRALKRGKLKDRTEDGLGGYFYGVLCDYLMDDFWRNVAGS